MFDPRLMGDPRLPFPTRKVAVPDGTVEVYIIPDDQRERVFKELYPFRPIPSLNRPWKISMPRSDSRSRTSWSSARAA